MILKNFAVFEGIDGTGTTTQLNLLSRRFAESRSGSADVLHITCEPTGNEIGTLIRKALSGEIQYHEQTIARLFAADRAEHVYGMHGILEHLQNGKAVFSDRYLFSSLAYQGEKAGADLAAELNDKFPLPEYVFYFDIDPVSAMARVDQRAGKKEIYEKLDFQILVRSRYQKIMTDLQSSHSDLQVIWIDASQSVGEISDYIWSTAKKLPKL